MPKNKRKVTPYKKQGNITISIPPMLFLLISVFVVGGIAAAVLLINSVPQF